MVRLAANDGLLWVPLILRYRYYNNAGLFTTSLVLLYMNTLRLFVCLCLHRDGDGMRLLTASSAASSAATTARSILGSKTKLLYPNGAVYTQRRPSTFDTAAAAAADAGVDGGTSVAADVLRVEHDDSSLDDVLAGNES
jgi:hypothetical protein